MIPEATTITDVLRSVAAGTIASVIGTAALAAVRVRDLRRNRALLLDKGVNADVLERAAAEAESHDTAVIHDVLENAVAEVAADQDLPPDLVRGALFARQADGSLRILRGQTTGFFASGEEQIRILPGETGAGEAARRREAAITVFQSPLEESTIRDPQERARIDPNLRWILAMPIFGADHEVVWVLTVDGLVAPRTQEHLRSSVAQLLYYQEILSLLLRVRTKQAA